MPDVKYTFEGDTSDLEKALQDTNGALNDMEKSAKKAGASMSKSLDKPGGSTKQLSKNADKAADSVKEMGDKAGDTDTALKGLAGAVGVFNPEAEKALMLSGDLVGGFEAMSKAAGLAGSTTLVALAGAVVVVGAAVAVAVQDFKTMRKEMSEIGGVLDGSILEEDGAAAADAAIDGLADATAKMARETLVLNGEITELEAKQLDASDALAKNFKPALNESAEDVSRTQKAVQGLTDHLELLRTQTLETATGSGNDKIIEQTEARLELAKEEAQEAEDALAIQRSNREAAQEAAVANLKLAEEQRAAAEARRKAEAAAARERAEEEAEERRRLAEIESATKSLQSTRESASQATLGSQDKLARQQELEIEQIKILGEITGDEALMQETLLEVRKRQVEEQIELEQQLADKLKRIRDEQGAAREEDADAEMALAGQVADSKFAIASTSFSAIGDLATVFAGKNKDAQLKAFRANKAAGIADATLSMLIGVSKASESPFPLNLILAAQAGIQGGVAVAKVAATPPPQFYQGEERVSAPPTGKLAMLHDGEQVRTRSQVEDSQASGGKSGGNMLINNWVFGVKVSTTLAKEIRRGSAVTTEITRRTGRLGHSKRNRT